MKPSMRDLREKTKQACWELRNITSRSPTLGGSLFHGKNMREAWEENAKIIMPFINAGELPSKVINDYMMRFHLAGEIYYHAKKHGLQSAMLLKLQRS